MIHFCRWHSRCGLEELGLNEERLLVGYFLAAANIFEPERYQERVAWVKTFALLETITSKYHDQEQRKAFVYEFNNTTSLYEW